MQRIDRVGIIGGTHGNELTGAHLVRHLASAAAWPTAPGVDVQVLLGNPRAFEKGQRYVEEDLNRCFDLLPGSSYERGRAGEIRARLLTGVEAEGLALFDLHTTTANMGVTLIPTSLGPFNLALCRELTERFEDVRVYLWQQPNAQPAFLNGLSSRGFAIEVGPVPQGVLRAEAVASTRRALEACLDFVPRFNRGPLVDDEGTLLVYRHVRHVDYPRDADGQPLAMVHPRLQDRDYAPIASGDPLFIGFDDRVTHYEGEDGLVPVFINEAAYYEKGIALALTRPERIPAPRMGS